MQTGSDVSTSSLRHSNNQFVSLILNEHALASRRAGRHTGQELTPWRAHISQRARAWVRWLLLARIKVCCCLVALERLKRSQIPQKALSELHPFLQSCKIVLRALLHSLLSQNCANGSHRLGDTSVCRREIARTSMVGPTSARFLRSNSSCSSK